MSKFITVPVNSFTTIEQAIHRIHEEVAEKGLVLKGIFYNKTSFFRGDIDVLVEDAKPIVKIERPSKFKPNATSRYYCVYKKGNGWTYKFVNKKISPKPFLGKIYETENAAAHAYDKHRFSVEGDLSKLNFPEHYAEG